MPVYAEGDDDEPAEQEGGEKEGGEKEGGEKDLGLIELENPLAKKGEQFEYQDLIGRIE